MVVCYTKFTKCYKFWWALQITFLASSERVMLPAYFNDAAGDLFTIVEKFWIVQNSGNALVTFLLRSLNSCGSLVEIWTKLIFLILIYRR